MKRTWKVASWVLLGLFLLGWAAFFRPQFLGGPARFVGVSGKSMTPTMRDGDLTMLHKRSTYRVGDVVAYRIPDGQAGAGSNVIHRVVGGNGQTGYTLRGDFNSWGDSWHPTDADMLGEVVLRVPGGASLLGQLRQPWVLAAFTGLLTFTIMLWPRRREDGRESIGANVVTPQPAATPAGFAIDARSAARAGVAVAVTIGAHGALRVLERSRR